MKLLFTFISICGLFSNFLQAQQSDSSLITQLIKDIASQQITKFDGEFYPGMFPGFRESGGAPHNYTRDNNIFHTSVLAFALRNMLPYLNEKNKIIAHRIINNAASAYPHYKNKDSLPFYNFWPTNKGFMPHSYYFKYLKGVFGQGEDADDSVIILMTNGADDSTKNILKKRLILVSNLSRGKRIISTYKKYRNIPAYSTYLGFRMTPDFDFGVQCNIMYFVYDSKLAFAKQDTATIQLLAETVKNREYMKAPTYISPYYVKSSVLIYHLTRLMAAFHIPELEQFKQQLIEDAKTQLSKSTNVMDKIILSTSLLRLNADVPKLNINNIDEFERSNQKQFIFFQARAAFSYPTPFKQIFLHWNYINSYFYCPAYNKTLWLEYLVERNKKK